jgi:CheY-like chemotaxis protein
MGANVLATNRPLQGVRILVVDDNPDHLEIIRGVLTHAGARVDTAHTAQEGFDAFEAAPHDIVISDLAMPHATGYNLIRRIRRSSRTSAVPAIAMTAFHADEHRDKALAAGFDEWVAKPAIESIVALVGGLLRR